MATTRVQIVSTVLALVHSSWLVILLITKGAGTDVAGWFSSFRHVLSWLGIFVLGTDEIPFQFGLSTVLFSAFQVLASLLLTCGIAVRVRLLAKVWMFHTTMILLLSVVYYLKFFISSASYENLLMFTFRTFSYYSFNFMFMLQIYRMTHGSSILQDPSGGQLIREKPSEFVQAFTAVSIVGYFAAIIVSSLSVSFHVSSAPTSPNWCSFLWFFVCALVVTGLWDVLVTDLQVGQIFTKGQWRWNQIFRLILVPLGLGLLVIQAVDESSFDGVLMLYFTGVFLPSLLLFVLAERRRISKAIP